MPPPPSLQMLSLLANRTLWLWGDSTSLQQLVALRCQLAEGGMQPDPEARRDQIPSHKSVYPATLQPDTSSPRPAQPDRCKRAAPSADRASCRRTPQANDACWPEPRPCSPEQGGRGAATNKVQRPLPRCPPAAAGHSRTSGVATCTLPRAELANVHHASQPPRICALVPKNHES